MEKTPIKVALERQIPEYIRGEYQLFVDFIKAYYEFLDQSQQRNLEDIRSIENTLEEFVTRFKKELSILFPTNTLENERFILQRIREFYQSRGSKESFQFLFRILFNKDSDIFYPSTQILRASDGKWIQEKSVFVKSQAGNLFNLSNKIILIQTANKTIYVYCPRVVYYREDIYEVFIDRSYVQDITLGDSVKSENGTDYGQIIPCPNKYTITSEGSGFEVGQLYYLKTESGDGSLIKITKTDSNGAIKKVQIISFGLDYKSTFYAQLSNKQAVALPYYSPITNFFREFTATAGQTTFNIDYTVGNISVYKNNVLLASSAYTATNGTSIILSSPAALVATIAFSGGGGTGATATATIARTVTGITITNAGTGYTAAPTIAFSGGGGTGATATATIANGAVTGITITNAGTGYTSAPTITISGGGGTGATAIVAAIGGPVTGITITNAGTGYTSAPTITISGGGGTGATATATITDGAVTGITITNAGTGYTSNDIIKVVTVNTSSTPFQDRTEGFIDFGYISKQTYLYLDNFYTNSSPGGGFTANQPQTKFYSDSSYVGEIIGSFYTVDTTSSLLSDSAEIKIELGPVAIYPGYYQTSDGFISDESYIQDGKYYQLFSYVIKVEQQIDTYLDVVKQLLHPAGMELFAEYTIKNEYLLSAVPEFSELRIRAFSQQFVLDDEGTNDVFKVNGDILSSPLAPFTHNVFGSADKYVILKGSAENPLTNSLVNHNGNFNHDDPAFNDFYYLYKGSESSPLENSLVNHESDFNHDDPTFNDFYIVNKASSSLVNHQSDFNHDNPLFDDKYVILKGSAENPLTNSLVNHNSEFNHDNPLFNDKYVILKGDAENPLTNSLVNHNSEFNHDNPLFNDKYVILKGSTENPLTNSLVNHNGNFNNDDPAYGDFYHVYKGSTSNPLTNSLVNHQSDFNHNNPLFDDKYIILKGSAENPLTNSLVNHNSEFNHDNPAFNDFYIVNKASSSLVNHQSDFNHDDPTYGDFYVFNQKSSSAQNVLDSFDREVTYNRSFNDINSVIDIYASEITRDTIVDYQTIVDLLISISRDLYRAPQLTLEGTITAGSDIITLSGYFNTGVQPGRTLTKVSGTGAFDAGVLVKESNISTPTVIKMTKPAITSGSIVFTTGFETPELADTLSSPADSLPVMNVNPFIIDNQVINSSPVREVQYSRSFNDINTLLDLLNNSINFATINDAQNIIDLRVNTQFDLSYSELINNTNTGTLYFNAYSQEDPSDPSSSYSYFETDYGERLTTALS